MLPIVSIIPVLLFLALLFMLDSFKLVKVRILLFAFFSGCICALLAYYLNTFLQIRLSIEFREYSRYLAPFIEESLEAIIILVLIKRKRIGFLIDAGIYGFTVGAGFSFVENIVYMIHINDPNLLTWIIRGLGTAIMHGATTALFAIFITGAVLANKKILTGLFPGLLIAVIIHSAYNHFYIHPLVQTLLIAFITPIALFFVFKHNENQLQGWLEVELYNEIELLGMIRKGVLKNSKSGQYLSSLKQHFPKEVIFDMYCFIGLFMELSIIAKRNILLAENDFPTIVEPGLNEKLIELEQLRKNIGKTGEIAISPLIRMNYRNLWKLGSLKKNFIKK
ncbi:MAG: PrsW family intramembrane metalloprotease [Prolixibacteraceae bacterium]|nr:PrsW family intramembrane metalloprotease [Prolixibacteraceae bacterium]